MATARSKPSSPRKKCAFQLLRFFQPAPTVSFARPHHNITTHNTHVPRMMPLGMPRFWALQRQDDRAKRPHGGLRCLAHHLGACWGGARSETADRPSAPVPPRSKTLQKTPP